MSELSDVAPMGPGPVHRKNVILKLWGDEVAGQVNDWIYVMGQRLVQMVFSIAPGGRFTQSDQWKPIYGADELYYVVKGTLVLANPETGEVVRAEEGEALHFHPDTWHHGFNNGPGELQVLEFFAPAPPQETVAEAGDGYGHARPPLRHPTYERNAVVGNWPPGGSEPAGRRTIHKADASKTLWRLEGEQRRILVGIMLSTPGLTAGRIELLPGQFSDVRTHAGDLALFVEHGRLNVLLPDEDGSARWSELHAEDGFYAPAGTPHRYFNETDEPVRCLFAVAPAYLPIGSA